MKKRDFFLIAGILLLAGVCWLLPRVTGMFGDTEPAVLEITVNGTKYGDYILSENQKIEIQDTNICEIMDGKVRMEAADCPDQLCMHQGPISMQGETIVCLPNRVVLEICSPEAENQVDSIAR